MTLWELAQSWQHEGHGWTILDGSGNDKTPPCRRCQLEQWAREKAKEWPFLDCVDRYRVEPHYLPFVADLGVPGDTND